MAKVHIFKPTVFPVVMDGCKSWTLKKGEHLRIDAFELWCWIKLLRVPWTVRSSSQSILKEINFLYLLAGLMLMLKLQYFGHLVGRTESLGNTLMLGEIESRRRRGWQRMRWLVSSTQWTWACTNSRRKWKTRKHGMLHSMGSKELDTTEWLNNNRKDTQRTLASRPTHTLWVFQKKWRRNDRQYFWRINV